MTEHKPGDHVWVFDVDDYTYYPVTIARVEGSTIYTHKGDSYASEHVFNREALCYYLVEFKDETLLEEVALTTNEARAIAREYYRKSRRCLIPPDIISVVEYEMD